MLRLQKTVEERFGHEISEDALRDAIALKNRRSVAQSANFYHLGQLNPPALSGSDILKVVYGATFRFDKEALINELDCNDRPRSSAVGRRPASWPASTHFNAPAAQLAAQQRKWCARLRERKMAAGLSVMKTAPGRKRPSNAWRETGDVYDALADKYLAIGCFLCFAERSAPANAQPDGGRISGRWRS